MRPRRARLSRVGTGRRVDGCASTPLGEFRPGDGHAFALEEVRVSVAEIPEPVHFGDVGEETADGVGPLMGLESASREVVATDFATNEVVLEPEALFDA